MSWNLLHTRRIFYLKDTADNWKATFVIDGRTYQKKEEVANACQAAFDFLDEHWIAAESEIQEVQEQEPDLGLPSWEVYKNIQQS